MKNNLFDLPKNPTIEIDGEDAVFPINRIFCVGRNYEAHAIEMGNLVDRDAPFYFTKSLRSVAHGKETIKYPSGTNNYHHEIELAVYIGKTGHKIDTKDAGSHIYGFSCALDMTRRDLQVIAKSKGRPWDLAKDVEESAVLGAITPAHRIENFESKHIKLFRNGELVQSAILSDMIHSTSEVIADLSQYYKLTEGDVILTGTPAGVGPVSLGDTLHATICGLVDLTVTLA